MKKLKTVGSFEGYTGELGVATFVDGISTEYFPQHIVDRMAAGMDFIEIDEDGNERRAGVQYRLIEESALRAPVIEPLERQSDDEKLQETTKAILDAETLPSLETRESLDAIAETSGIKGLREIAAKWGVKHRSIPTLIEMIIDAQDRYLAERDARLAAKMEEEADRIAAHSPQPVSEVEGEPADDEDLMPIDAAATGDLSAAITEGAKEEPVILLGSSVLASTYEIGDETVTLGEIVASAFATFGGSAEDWNGLADESREDLLRLELDRRLAE